MEQARSASLIRSLRYDLRPELRDKKFSYHLITSILKLQNSVAQIHDFLVCTNIYLNDPILMLFVKSFKSCLSISCNSIGYFKQPLKSNRLLRLSKAFSLAEKMEFRAKNTMICE